MIYRIEPLNEGQDMNLSSRQRLDNRSVALFHARQVARGIQHWFPDALISIRIQSVRDFDAGKNNAIIAYPDGRFLRESTGKALHISI